MVVEFVAILSSEEYPNLFLNVLIPPGRRVIVSLSSLSQFVPLTLESDLLPRPVVMSC
jgi:hypothetical protein